MTNSGVKRRRKLVPRLTATGEAAWEAAGKGGRTEAPSFFRLGCYGVRESRPGIGPWIPLWPGTSAGMPWDPETGTGTCYPT